MGKDRALFSFLSEEDVCVKEIWSVKDKVGRVKCGARWE